MLKGVITQKVLLNKLEVLQKKSLLLTIFQQMQKFPKKHKSLFLMEHLEKCPS